MSGETRTHDFDVTYMGGAYLVSCSCGWRGGVTHWSVNTAWAEWSDHSDLANREGRP